MPRNPATRHPPLSCNARKWGVLALCIASCIPTPGPIQVTRLLLKPNQDEAASIIQATFAEYAGDSCDTRTTPTVEWIPGKSFRCSFNWCRGTYYREIHLARVAWPPGNHSFANTSMAHEFCHAFFPLDKHDICVNELPPILIANQRLRFAGL